LPYLSGGIGYFLNDIDSDYVDIDADPFTAGLGLKFYF
jgi:hypothetical protein